MKKIYLIKNTTILSSLCQNTCKVISHLYLYHNVKKIENGWSILFKSDGGTNIYPVASINIAICSIVILGDIFSYIFYMNLDLLPL